MIFTILLTLVYWIVYTVFSPLPTGQALPDAVHTAAEWFGDSIMSLNFIMPVTEIFAVMEIGIYMVIIASSIRFMIWIVGVIRGSGTTI